MSSPKRQPLHESQIVQVWLTLDGSAAPSTPMPIDAQETDKMNIDAIQATSPGEDITFHYANVDTFALLPT